MSAQVVSFPRGMVHSPPAPTGQRAASGTAGARYYTFMEVVRLLQLQGERRTLITHLRTLAARHHMPAPVNPRAWAGRLLFGADGIGINSRWAAGEFDHWLHTQRNPPPVAGAAPPVPRVDRDDMRRRAQQLGGC